LKCHLRWQRVNRKEPNREYDDRNPPHGYFAAQAMPTGPGEAPFSPKKTAVRITIYSASNVKMLGDSGHGVHECHFKSPRIQYSLQTF
jgi:hypothetical protein